MCAGEWVNYSRHMSTEPRILPSEWTGTSTEVSWGLVFGENHPKFETHGQLDPSMHTGTEDITLRIISQVGRAVEIVFETHSGKIGAIGLLSHDGRRLEVTGPLGHATYLIDGNTMTGTSNYKVNGSGGASDEYGVGMAELTARL